MPKITVKISEEKNQILEDLCGENGQYKSKSEALENFIKKGKRLNELEKKVEKLEKEKEKILQKQKENIDFVEYAQKEFKYRNASVLKRLKWWIFGENN